MTPQTLQRRIAKHLKAGGLEPDLLDSYGNLLTFRKLVRAETGQESAKGYAWQILDALRGCKVYDYFEGWFRGQQYYVVRFEAPHPLSARRPPALRNEARPPKVRPQPAARVEPAPVVIETEPDTPIEAEQRKGEEPAPVGFEAEPAPTPKRDGADAGSYLEKRVQPAVGQVAWTIVTKKGGEQPKQARCEVIGVSAALPLGGQGEWLAEVRLTKTKQKLQVSLEKLFDHVPHQKAGGMWL